MTELWEFLKQVAVALKHPSSAFLLMSGVCVVGLDALSTRYSTIWNAETIALGVLATLFFVLAVILAVRRNALGVNAFLNATVYSFFAMVLLGGGWILVIFVVACALSTTALYFARERSRNAPNEIL